MSDLAQKLRAALIDQHAREGEVTGRALGASYLGGPCDRALWLTFRRALPRPMDGDLGRRLDLGSVMEKAVAEELAAELGSHWNPKPGVLSVMGGLVVSILDGVADIGGQRYIVEIKAPSKRKFDQIAMHGIEAAEPRYRAQIQTSLAIASKQWPEPPAGCLAIVSCADTGELHTELIEHDESVSNKYGHRAVGIVTSEEMPAGVSDDPDYHACMDCHFSAICHSGQEARKECRTCQHIVLDAQRGEFSCAKVGGPIPDPLLGEACPHHIFIEGLEGVAF